MTSQSGWLAGQERRSQLARQTPGVCPPPSSSSRRRPEGSPGSARPRRPFLAVHVPQLWWRDCIRGRPSNPAAVTQRRQTSVPKSVHPASRRPRRPAGTRVAPASSPTPHPVRRALRTRRRRSHTIGGCNPCVPGQPPPASSTRSTRLPRSESGSGRPRCHGRRSDQRPGSGSHLRRSGGRNRGVAVEAVVDNGVYAAPRQALAEGERRLGHLTADSNPVRRMRSRSWALERSFESVSHRGPAGVAGAVWSARQPHEGSPTCVTQAGPLAFTAVGVGTAGVGAVAA